VKVVSIFSPSLSPGLSRYARNESFTWGYYLATRITAFHIQPLRGLGPCPFLPRFHLGLLSRYANYCVSYSTPSGLGPCPFLPRFHLGLLSRYANYCVSYSTPSGLGPCPFLPRSHSTPSGLGPN
jgi:hypothetical protein